METERSEEAPYRGLPTRKRGGALFPARQLKFSGIPPANKVSVAGKIRFKPIFCKISFWDYKFLSFIKLKFTKNFNKNA
ncbi:MAG: hypothetical protein A2166_00830 [Omnitrophica WOR_2 bacterium RBG_13_41_10]|nr:MAG: hypothetical protein A2166_00830 [Omnitrophica WOR_2 bacterium RBG_13_41_10]